MDKINELKYKKELDGLRKENKELNARNKKLLSKEKEFKDSRSWKLTSPLRKMGKKLK